MIAANPCATERERTIPSPPSGSPLALIGRHPRSIHISRLATLPLPRAWRQRSFELDVNEQAGMRERMSF
jgi:hypothetical protein